MEERTWFRNEGSRQAPQIGQVLRRSRRGLVVVTSTQHFHAAFAPIAGETRYVSGPGAIPPDYETIPFTKRTQPYWPRIADPFERADKV